MSGGRKGLAAIIPRTGFPPGHGIFTPRRRCRPFVMPTLSIHKGMTMPTLKEFSRIALVVGILLALRWVEQITVLPAGVISTSLKSRVLPADEPGFGVDEGAVPDRGALPSRLGLQPDALTLSHPGSARPDSLPNTDRTGEGTGWLAARLPAASSGTVLDAAILAMLVAAGLLLTRRRRNRLGRPSIVARFLIAKGEPQV